MDKYSQKVIDTFFQTFYDERIKIVKQVGQSYHNQLDISLLTFWFSVIDFYGGIYYIGKKDRKKTWGGTNLKLADKKTFNLFIKDFFPSPENELGNFLYSVFRSGIVHQLSPKKAGLVWDSRNPKLVWVKIDSNNCDRLSNKVATINIHQLENLAYAAYTEFKRKVEKDEIVGICENIFNHLIAIPDGLEDGKTIDKEFSSLPPEIQSLITQ